MHPLSRPMHDHYELDHLLKSMLTGVRGRVVWSDECNTIEKSDVCEFEASHYDRICARLLDVTIR